LTAEVLDVDSALDAASEIDTKFIEWVLVCRRHFLSHTDQNCRDNIVVMEVYFGELNTQTLLQTKSYPIESFLSEYHDLSS
jgi:hypothetical protein